MSLQQLRHGLGALREIRIYGREGVLSRPSASSFREELARVQTSPPRWSPMCSA